ncbi:GH36 C-terminal domain-containing protein, partial [Veillonella sp.]|uniref:GH36 C-terminal domain-containing protein n=1 Tax=Veillonella sp. TaxID=1926307 RepID=UPI0029046F7B
WMIVSEDKKEAIVAYFKVLNDVNCPLRRMKLHGLDENLVYSIKGTNNAHYGSELMNLGLITTDSSSGQVVEEGERCADYRSKIYVLKAEI